MPRPDPRRPREGQESLFPAPTTRDDIRLNTGRHQLAFNDALNSAYDQGHITDLDGALASTLMAGAWALDAFEAQNKPYGPTKILDQMVNALREARMTPDSRGDATDEALQELLAGLADPDDEAGEEVNDDASATALPHTAQPEQ